MPKLRRLDYAIVTALYAAAVMAARGMGFRMTIPWDFYQLLDARALREHPFGSLCLMHHQPPGLNTLLAGILTVADRVGCTPEALVTVLFLVLGLVAAIVSYRLVLGLTDSRVLAAFAVGFLLTDPAYHAFANLFFYEFLLYALHLLLLAAALDYLVHGRRLLLVGLLACAITLTRTLFHPIWTVTLCAFVVLMRRWSSPAAGAVDARRALALSALVAVTIALWPLKNRIVFGRTFYATMSSYSLARGLPGCGSRELNSYLVTGAVAPGAAALAARPLERCGDAASGVILSTVKADGSRNWNHLVFLAVAEGFDRCSAAWRMDHPREWLQRAAGQYAMWMRGGYVNSYDQHVSGPFERSYYAYALRYDRVVYANLRPLLERRFPHWTLHQAATVGGRPVPYTLFGFVLFPLTVAAVLVRWLRAPWTPREAAVAIAMFSVLWAMLGACATDGIEGNRMRFSTTGLFAVILAYAIHAVYELVRGRRLAA